MKKKAEQLQLFVVDGLQMGDILPINDSIQFTVTAGLTDIRVERKYIRSEHPYKSPLGLMTYLHTSIVSKQYPFDLPVAMTKDITADSEYQARFGEDIGSHKFARAMRELGHIQTQWSLKDFDGVESQAWIVRQHKRMSRKTKEELEDLINNAGVDKVVDRPPPVYDKDKDLNTIHDSFIGYVLNIDNNKD